MKKISIVKHMLLGLCCALPIGGTMAHDSGSVAGEPVAQEGNYIMADAQNPPFATPGGPGRVVEKHG